MRILKPTASRFVFTVVAAASVTCLAACSADDTARDATDVSASTGALTSDTACPDGDRYRMIRFASADVAPLACADVAGRRGAWVHTGSDPVDACVSKRE